MPSKTSAIDLGPRVFLALGTALLALTLAAMAHGQAVEVDRATGRAGETVEVAVRYVAQGSAASALRVDLGFETAGPILIRDGSPACDVNPDILKESTIFAFTPAACTPGIDCTGLRAGIISLTEENNAVPLGSGVVFTCLFAVPAAAVPEDVFRIAVSSASAVFADGHEVALGAGYDGSVRVVDAAPGCPGDSDGNGNVALGEVQKAFDAYINGCPQEP